MPLPFVVVSRAINSRRPNLLRRSLSRKLFVIALLTIAYAAAITYLVDFGGVVSTLKEIPVRALGIAFSLTVLANLFAFARSAAVLRALDFRPRWNDLFLAFSASNVSNLPLNIVGQSLTRAMVLVRAGVPFGVTVFATYIERFLAAGLLFLFSVVGLWYLLGGVPMDLDSGGGELLVTIGGIGILTGALGLTVLRRQFSEFAAASMGWLVRLWPSAILTILAHAAGIGAYLVLLAQLDPHSVSAGIVAALTIVLLVTSLPISFAGWGLRELSAASALGLVGIAPEKSVAAAVVIGVLYLAATGLFGAFGLILLGRKRQGGVPAMYTDESAARRDSAQSMGWDTKLIEACAVLCAILMFFRIPTQLALNGAAVNVNVADIVVFIALSVVVLTIASGRVRHLFPGPLNAMLAAVSFFIALGLLVSYANGNLSQWALYVRGAGWILMLGYAALGAAMVTFTGDAGRTLILRTVIFAGIVICSLQLTMFAWSALVFSLPMWLISYPLQGFANNQNAFAFELAMVGTLAIVGRALGVFERKEWVFDLCVAVLAATFYLTASRTGAVFVVMLAVLDHISRRKVSTDPQPARFRVTYVAALAMTLALFLPYIVYFLALALEHALGIKLDANALFVALTPSDAIGKMRIVHGSADAERWATIVGGFRLWLDSPFLGAGLGAYEESIRAAAQEVHGIHSVYLWFLAEMGVLGFVAVTAFGAVLALTAWRKMSIPGAAPWALGAVGILSYMAVGGLVQNFFYQRIFWFLLGLTATIGAGKMTRASNPRLFLAAVTGLVLIVFVLAL